MTQTLIQAAPAALPATPSTVEPPVARPAAASATDAAVAAETPAFEQIWQAILPDASLPARPVATPAATTDEADTGESTPAAPQANLIATLLAPLIAPQAMAQSQATSAAAAPAQQLTAKVSADEPVSPSAKPQDIRLSLPQAPLSALAPAPAPVTLPRSTPVEARALLEANAAPVPHTASTTSQTAGPITPLASQPDAAAPVSEPGSPLAMPQTSAPAPTVEATPLLKLVDKAPSQWRAPLHEALGDRLQWQVQQGREQAVIRLDPPNLGRIDITIRQEGQLMQVHLSATHREVVQQLQGLSDQLRQDLSLRQSADVSVSVSDQSRQGDARQQARRDADPQSARSPGRALSGDEDGSSDTPFHFQPNRGA